MPAPQLHAFDFYFSQDAALQFFKNQAGRRWQLLLPFFLEDAFTHCLPHRSAPPIVKARYLGSGNLEDIRVYPPVKATDMHSFKPLNTRARQKEN